MLSHIFHLPHSPEDALAAHRDGLPDFGPLLPGVARVVRVDDLDDGGARVLSHAWEADVRYLPGMLRRIVPPEHFTWRDTSRWEADRGAWAIHIPVLGEGPQLRGTHRFTPADGGCQVSIEAEVLFAADPDARILGIRVGRIVAPLLERLVGEMLARVALESGPVIAAWLEGRRQAA